MYRQKGEPFYASKYNAFILFFVLPHFNVFLKEDIFLTKILLSVESTGCIFGNKIFPGNVETLIKWNRVLESVVSLPKRGM